MKAIEKVLLTAVGSLLLNSTALAQSVPSVKPGNFELGAFVGESHGLDRWRPMFGGNVAYGIITRHLYPFAEASYLPGLERQLTSGGGSVLRYNVDMFDIHGGMHYRILRPESRIVPYLVGGVGLLRTSATNYTSTLPGTNITQPNTLDPQNSFAINFGGGLRAFFTEKFGIRVEFKAYRPTSFPLAVTNSIIYRFAIGPVFQLK